MIDPDKCPECGEPYSASDPTDSNVESVREKLRIRAEHGFAKYGVTTERTDIDLLGWLNHLQEELMDATVYIERAMKEVRESKKPREEQRE